MPCQTTALNAPCSVALALRCRAASQLPRNSCAPGELRRYSMPAPTHSRISASIESNSVVFVSEAHMPRRTTALNTPCSVVLALRAALRPSCRGTSAPLASSRHTGCLQPCADWDQPWMLLSLLRCNFRGPHAMALHCSERTLLCGLGTVVQCCSQLPRKFYTPGELCNYKMPAAVPCVGQRCIKSAQLKRRYAWCLGVTFSIARNSAMSE